MIDVPVRVRDALKSGAYLNNYRVVVLKDNGDEDFTIDNDNLVTESVKIDERMCSTDTLKFGLCEGTNVEFQFFGYPNITNRKIKLYIDVNYRDTDKVMQTYSIPLGWYQIKECSRQAETGIIKASGYNKLLSDYLDKDVTAQIKSIITAGESGVSGSISIAKALSILLENYSIETFTTGSIEASWGYFQYSAPSNNIALLNENGTFTGKYLCVISPRCYPLPEITDNEYYRITTKGQGILNYYKNNLFSNYLDYYIAVADGIDEGGVHYTCKKVGKVLEDGVKLVTYQGVDLNSELVTVFGSEVVLKSKSASILYQDKRSDVNTISSPNYTHLYDGTIDPNEGKLPILVGFSSWIKETTSAAYVPTFAETDAARQAFSELPFSALFAFEHVDYSAMEKFRLTSSNVSSITNGLTLRALQSATFELSAQYGKLDRVSDLFSGVTLNGGRLLPSDTLYPANDLYPMSVSERADKAMYSKLWADEGNIHKFRNLIVTYKNSSTNQDATITKVVNADGTDDYEMSDNWLLKNLTWTQAQVNTYANAMVTAMQNVTWFPFQMWCAGLPYIEAGDEIEISCGGTTYTTYVLTRNLSGIQDLQDVYVNGTLNIF